MKKEKSVLSEVFKLDEAGWIPINLDEAEWGVVKMALDKYNSPDQNVKKLIDGIKKKLQVIGGDHDIKMGRSVELDKLASQYNSSTIPNQQ